MNDNNSEHWNAIYSTTPTEKLGWYEAHPQPSLDLIIRCQLERDDPILDAGSGTSSLLGHLVKLGFSRLYAVDFSLQAIITSQARLIAQHAACVDWIAADLSDPESAAVLPPVRLWHDRAVLHFLTADKQLSSYLHTLRSVLQPGGYVILAAFALGGATQCSGLPVYNYDQERFSNFLGPDFTILDCIEHLYRMPSGDIRPYTYIRAQYGKPA
jgi:cyclopropane fatty-acyl-phospholipid synthase-like methyltransferase